MLYIRTIIRRVKIFIPDHWWVIKKSSTNLSRIPTVWRYNYQWNPAQPAFIRIGCCKQTCAIKRLVCHPDVLERRNWETSGIILRCTQTVQIVCSWSRSSCRSAFILIIIIIIHQHNRCFNKRSDEIRAGHQTLLVFSSLSQIPQSIVCHVRGKKKQFTR